MPYKVHIHSWISKTWSWLSFELGWCTTKSAVRPSCSPSASSAVHGRRDQLKGQMSVVPAASKRERPGTNPLVKACTHYHCYRSSNMQSSAKPRKRKQTKQSWPVSAVLHSGFYMISTHGASCLSLQTIAKPNWQKPYSLNLLDHNGRNRNSHYNFSGMFPPDSPPNLQPSLSPC